MGAGVSYENCKAHNSQVDLNLSMPKEESPKCPQSFCLGRRMRTPDPCFSNTTSTALSKNSWYGDENEKQREKLEGHFHGEALI